MIKSYPLLTCLLSLCSLGSAFAHDILLIPSKATDATGTKVMIKYGHPADYSLPEREKIFSLELAPNPGGAPRVSLLDKIESNTSDTLAVPLTKEQLASPGIAILWAQFDNGYYAEIDNDHYFNTSKRELPKARKSGHYLKFAKALFPSTATGDQKSTGYDRVLGCRLELVPLADPFTLKPGDELPVRILFEGKPVAAGTEVDIISGDFPMTKGMQLPTYQTDAQGVARVKIERPGVQSLGADHIVTPSQDPQLADVDNYASSLSFLLPAP